MSTAAYLIIEVATPHGSYPWNFRKHLVCIEGHYTSDRDLAHRTHVFHVSSDKIIAVVLISKTSSWFFSIGRSRLVSIFLCTRGTFWVFVYGIAHFVFPQVFICAFTNIDTLIEIDQQLYLQFCVVHSTLHAFCRNRPYEVLTWSFRITAAPSEFA